MGVFHLLIIWSNALSKKEYIINDLKNNFEIRKIFKIHWDESFFIDNLKTFYAHSQKHLDEKKYTDLLEIKKKSCGDQDFFAIIFKDLNPIFSYRDTSGGNVLVNVNVYDKKIEYRHTLSNSFDIHASNDEWETNKDLTVLFGLNVNDFCMKYPKNDEKIELYSSNTIGLGGFQSIQQLFYLLNNSIKYCVLRNFECLPFKNTEDGHGDIDLLVENVNYIRYLTHAVPVFTESYRVCYTINVNGENIPFDFRYVGDNYYYAHWEESILDTRVMYKCFYIPNNENLYYSLLYHAYIQKATVKPDYIPKLSEYAKKINTFYKNEVKCAVSDLDIFFMKNGFEYVQPTDRSVFYNHNNLMFSKIVSCYGIFLNDNEVYVDGVKFISKIYKKESSYIKRGSHYIIRNEYDFLRRLSNYEHFPKILNYSYGVKDSFIELSSVRGLLFEDFYKRLRNQHYSSKLSFIKKMFSVLCILKEKNILHRDVNPQNIIIDSNNNDSVSLIDFGWAIDFIDKKPNVTPVFLGTRFGFYYRPLNGFSDFYSLGVILDKYWGNWPYIKKISIKLKDILPEDYEDVNKLDDKICKVKESIYNGHFSVIDFKRELGVCYRRLRFFIKNKFRCSA